MKITFIIDHLFGDTAGTENQVVKLVRGLAPRHEVELICLRDSAWLEAQRGHMAAQLTVLKLRGITTPSFWGGLVALYKHLRRTKPDVVHTFFPVANIFGVLCAHHAGVGTVVASRRDYGHWMTPRYLAATRYANRRLQGIVTNSQQVKALTVRVEGVPAERIAVIPNGVDVAHLRRDGPDLVLKARLGLPAQARVVGLVANFRPVKRQDTLVDALALLRDTQPDLHVLFVGGDNADEPARDKVFTHARSLGLAERVHNAKADGNIADFLSVLDVGVNCSESEGLSNAVVEYMCAGVPCVISDGGGNRDLVQHEATGLLYPVGDAAALAAGLQRMLCDKALQQRCTAAALAMVGEKMALPAVLSQFEQAYASFESHAPATAGASAARKTLVQLGKQAGLTMLASRPARQLAAALRPRPAVAVLMYHELGGDDEEVDAWQLVRRGDFLRQVEQIRQRMDIVSLDDALQRIASGHVGPRPLAVLTFDDGDAGNVEHLLPLLRSEALPATVYLATGHIESQRGYWFDRLVNLLQHGQATSVDLRRHGLGQHSVNQQRGAANWARIQRLLQAMKALPAQRCEDIVDELEQGSAWPARPALRPMTVAQVSELAACPQVTLGSHTHGHEVLTLLDDEQVRATVRASLDRLQRWVGQEVKHFAFPGGFHDARVEAVVRDMGFATAMGGGVGLWLPGTPLHAIPRLPVGRYDSLRRFGIELDWGHALRRRAGAARALSYLAAGVSAAALPLQDLS